MQTTIPHRDSNRVCSFSIADQNAAVVAQGYSLTRFQTPPGRPGEKQRNGPVWSIDGQYSLGPSQPSLREHHRPAVPDGAATGAPAAGVPLVGILWWRLVGRVLQSLRWHIRAVWVITVLLEEGYPKPRRIRQQRIEFLLLCRCIWRRFPSFAVRPFCLEETSAIAMSDSAPKSPQPPPLAVSMTAIAVGNFTLCLAGLIWRSKTAGVSPVWPAAGLALFAVVRVGYPALLPLLVSKIAANMVFGDPWALAI